MYRQLSLLILLFCLSFSMLSAQEFDPKQITIVRDSFGVPHIFAKTDAEVAYGLGWVTCENDVETLQWGLLAARKRRWLACRFAWI